MIIKPPKFSLVNRKSLLGGNMVYCGTMNEGSGLSILDASGYENDGVIYNALWKPGRFGPRLWHDGTSDFTAVQHSQSLYLADRDFAISVWIQTTTSHTGMVVAKGDAAGSPNDAYQLYTRTTDPYVRLFTQDSGGDSSATASMSINIHDGKLHHILAQRVDTRLQIYVDAILRSDEALTLRAVGSAGSLYIGRRINSGSENLPFQGYIDVPMIWNRGLSFGEIVHLYRNPFCMFGRMPLELWVAATSIAGVAQNYVRTVNDSLGVADSSSRTKALLRIIAESVGIEDAEKKDETKVIVEALGLTDTGSIIDRSVVLQQLLGIVDSISGLDYTRKIDDDVGVMDSMLRVVEMPRVINESLGMSDTVLRAVAIIRNIADDVGVEDDVLRTAEVLRTIVDDVGVEDDVLRTVAMLRTIAESLGIFDEISTADLVTAALVFMVIRQTHI